MDWWTSEFFGIVKALILPSIMVLLVPLLIASIRMKGFAVLRAQVSMAQVRQEEKMRGSVSVFTAGVVGLVLVPIIKTITGLPPFIGVTYFFINGIIGFNYLS